jgi:hypothetical protein
VRLILKKSELPARVCWAARLIGRILQRACSAVAPPGCLVCSTRSCQQRARKVDNAKLTMQSCDNVWR